ADFIKVAHPDAEFRKAAEKTRIDIGTVVEKRVAELFMFDFEISGIHLDEAKRSKVVNLNVKLLDLSYEFLQASHHPQAIEKRYIPEHIRHCFSVDGDSIQIGGLHADSPSERVREAAYKIFLYPNPSLLLCLDELLACTYELAKLVGFESFAHRALKGTMANSPGKMASSVTAIHPDCLITASKFLCGLLQLNCGLYTCNIDPALYSPYFSLGVCMEGLNALFHQLLGVSFHAEEPLAGEVWSDDVRKLAPGAPDFAEVPSILMEFFASDYRIMSQFACHYQTGEPLPESMVSRLCQSKRVCGAADTQLQIFYAALDQVYHDKPKCTTTTEILRYARERGSCGSAIWLATVQSTTPTSCPDLWPPWCGGSASSKTLNRAMGEHFRREMLAHGGSKEPMLMVEGMLQKTPTIEDFVEALVLDLDEFKS
ncbi:hypothetical protein P4O66_005936, partial [Electrophorus voltai]